MNVKSNILVKNGVKQIEELKIGDEVKTLLGNKKIINIKKVKEMTYKFILSDGNKFICEGSQQILTATNGFVKASELEEGVVLKKIDDKTSNVVDITELSEKECYQLKIEDNSYYILLGSIFLKNVF